MPETLNKAPIAIVDEDHSPLSARIADAFYPPLLPAAEADHAGGNGRAHGRRAPTPSPSTSRRTSSATCWPGARQRSSSTSMRHGCRQAFTGSGYIQTIVTGEVQPIRSRATGRRRRCRSISRCGRAFNPKLSKSWFGAVMQLINQITMLSIVLTGAALIREREHGTIEHLLVMPVTPFEIMIEQDLVDGAGRARRLSAVADLRRAGRAGGADRTARSPLFVVRRGAAAVRHDGAGDLPGHLPARCRSSGCC